MNPIRIQTVELIGDYSLRFQFEDGKSSLVDFEAFLSKSQNPSIRKYLDPKLFADFKLEDGDLMWGDFDLLFPIDEIYSGVFAKQNSWLQTA